MTETLRRISAIGYHTVEISQIPMTPVNVSELARAGGELGVEISQIPMTPVNVSELARAGGELGVEIAALSVALETPKGMPGDSLTDDFDKIVADAHRLDAKLFRIGMLPLPALRSVEAIIDFAKRANAYAERLQDNGLGLNYHNHHVELAKLDGTEGLGFSKECRCLPHHDFGLLEGDQVGRVMRRVRVCEQTAEFAWQGGVTQRDLPQQSHGLCLRSGPGRPPRGTHVPDHDERGIQPVSMGRPDR